MDKFKINLVRFLSLFMLNKEKRRLFRKNLFRKYIYDFVDLPGNSYAMKPFHVESQKTTIGNFVSIAKNVSLGYGLHPINLISTSPSIYKNNKKYYSPDVAQAPIHIGHDVWIGADVAVMNGVSIGTGSVIGAKSVVTKDIPPYAIAVGVPARVIKYRFDNDIINMLLSSKWWEYPVEVIEKLPYDNPVEFINELNKFSESHSNCGEDSQEGRLKN